MQRCNLQQLKTQLSTHHQFVIVRRQIDGNRCQPPAGAGPPARRDGEQVLYVMENGPAATEPEQFPAVCGPIFPWSSAPGPGGPARRPNRRIGLALGATGGCCNGAEHWLKPPRMSHCGK